MIPAERKFQDRFRFRNEARLIFGANELPKHSKGGFAWNRRWIIIDFPVTFSGAQEDKNLDRKLQTDEELSGLLNFTLMALKWLLETKTFFYSKTPEEVGAEYLLKSDSVMAFMQECTTPADEIVTKTELYKAYVEWGIARKIKKIEAINRFGILMKRGGYTDTRPRVEGERPTCYEGFVLNITKIEELLKVNKTQNGQSSVKNEEKALTTNQTNINQVAAPHWFPLITKNGQDGQGYSPDKHIEVILLLGRERRIGIDEVEDLREIIDHLGQSIEITHNKEAAVSEKRVVMDELEKLTEIATRPQKEHNSVTEYEKRVLAEITTNSMVENEKRKNIAENKIEKNLGHSDQPIENVHTIEARDSEYLMIQDVREKAQIWQGMKGQLNSTNVGAFSMWYCDQSGNGHGPTRIKEIASKIFLLTPEPPKKDESQEPCDPFTEKKGWVVTQRSAIKVSGEENQIELGNFDDKEKGV
jgi:hypothetical protein